MDKPTEVKKPRRPGIRKGVRKETIENVAARLQAADEAKTVEFSVSQVPLSSIVLWEDQPRDILLSIDDVIRGYVQEDDEYTAAKNNELEGIQTLALSIKDTGLNNSPIAYSLPGQKVKLIGGQRRTMAVIYSLFHVSTETLESGEKTHDVNINQNPELDLLDSTRISVKVFTRKPDPMAIEKIGMADNLHEGLSLKAKIDWAIKISEQKESGGGNVHWSDLIGTLGVSRAQAFKWVKFLSDRDDEWVGQGIDLVRSDKLSLTKLFDIAYSDDREATFNNLTGKKRLPVDGAKRISLGAVTTNYSAVKKLILANIDDDYQAEFNSVDWKNPLKVKKAFARFFEIWEKHYG